MVSVIIFGGLFLFFLIVTTIFLFMVLSWNIPITIFRFTGNKERPSMILAKGRKKIINGVPHLWVRGYKDPVRDFKAEFYYPSPKKKYGGLVLWEFEDGWLTPAIPKRTKLTEEQQKIVQRSLYVINQLQKVDFQYDKEVHHKLMLKIVDDVDADFYVQQLSRQNTQYVGGFMDFLNRHSGAIIVVFVAAFLLVGFIVFLDKSPQLLAECAGAARNTLIEGLRDQAIEAATAPPA